MISIVCTLFEGDYHYGVAALTNSLYHNGFRGIIYAGYRGSLPKWAKKAQQHVIEIYKNTLVLDVAVDLQLVFLPLETDYHLTNYKPDFMLELLNGPAKDCDAIYYFDPDICVVEKWDFFEEWVSCGIALCEDVNSPLPKSHPRRIGWRRHFSKYGFNLKFKLPEYVNGGFVGVIRKNFEFIKLWQTMQIAMTDEIGSLTASKLARGAAFKTKGFAYCFDASDQDALNAAVESTDCLVSVIGKEAMGFKYGGTIIPHALGPGKPWQKINLIEAFRGHPPRLVDKVFWKHVSAPIPCFHPFAVFLYQIDLMLATLLGRVWRRG